MKSLIVVASQREIKNFLDQNRINCHVPMGESGFVETELADILITGIGIPACMFQLCQTLFTKKYKLVIHCGIAGTYKNINTGSVVNIVTEEFGDLGIEDKTNFYSLFEKKLARPNSKPFIEGVLINPFEKQFQAIAHLPKCAGLTLNKTSGNFENISALTKKYPHAEIESMEGAAVFYVCLNLRIPFVELRAISNLVEERDVTKWDIETAVKNLSMEMQNFIQSVK